MITWNKKYKKFISESNNTIIKNEEEYFYNFIYEYLQVLKQKENWNKLIEIYNDNNKYHSLSFMNDFKENEIEYYNYTAEEILKDIDYGYFNYADKYYSIARGKYVSYAAEEVEEGIFNNIREIEDIIDKMYEDYKFNRSCQTKEILKAFTDIKYLINKNIETATI